MHHRMDNAGPLLAAAGAYLVWRGIVFWGLVLLVIGLGKLYRWWQDPRRTLAREITMDASRHGCRIPRNREVWRGLETVYVKRRRASESYPQLAPTYDELVESMWLELRATTTLSEWRRILRSVGQAWPVPFPEGESPVAESLRKAQRAARQWRDAHREASTPLA